MTSSNPAPATQSARSVRSHSSRSKKLKETTPAKKQLDGSVVISSPQDPVNSEETLRRNKTGDS